MSAFPSAANSGQYFAPLSSKETRPAIYQHGRSRHRRSPSRWTKQQAIESCSQAVVAAMSLPAAPEVGNDLPADHHRVAAPISPWSREFSRRPRAGTLVLRRAVAVAARYRGFRCLRDIGSFSIQDIGGLFAPHSAVVVQSDELHKRVSTPIVTKDVRAPFSGARSAECAT